LLSIFPYFYFITFCNILTIFLICQGLWRLLEKAMKEFLSNLEMGFKIGHAPLWNSIAHASGYHFPNTRTKETRRGICWGHVLTHLFLSTGIPSKVEVWRPLTAFITRESHNMQSQSKKTQMPDWQRVTYIFFKWAVGEISRSCRC
jgi:hypothetical protein